MCVLEISSRFYTPFPKRGHDASETEDGPLDTCALYNLCWVHEIYDTRCFGGRVKDDTTNDIIGS